MVGVQWSVELGASRGHIFGGRSETNCWSMGSALETGNSELATGSRNPTLAKREGGYKSQLGRAALGCAGSAAWLGDVQFAFSRGCPLICS